MMWAVTCLLICCTSIVGTVLLLLYFEVEATWEQFWTFIDVKDEEKEKECDYEE